MRRFGAEEINMRVRTYATNKYLYSFEEIGEEMNESVT
jgi:hypothetical protein